MVERIEIKKLVKEAVSRDPPLEWYLYNVHAYGHFISKLTDYVDSLRLNNSDSCKRTIRRMIYNSNPVNYVLNDHKYENRYMFENIYNN